MDKNKNIIYIAITGILIIVVIVMFFIFDKDKTWQMEQFDDRVEEYNNRVAQRKLDAEEQNARNEEILAQTPGIACWGDGFTYGTYGEGTSYPSVLRELIEENDYPYDVVNLGVYGEDSRTVLGRQGSIPFLISEDFAIDTMDLIKISIESEDGSEVNPCIQDYNPGFNPCTVAGVNCTIYGETTAEDITKANGYYLSRQDSSTKTVDVKAGTVVVTSGSTEYTKYINILQAGDGGGYSTDSELVEQEKKFAASIDGGKYVIIGRLGGTTVSNQAYDSQMENAFGSKYINAREILCADEVDGVEYTQADRQQMTEGLIPDCLKSNGYLNEKGYEALGKAVFERLEEIGLVEK